MPGTFWPGAQIARPAVLRKLNRIDPAIGRGKSLDGRAPRQIPGALLPPPRHGPRLARPVKAHPNYESTAEFCALYDNPAFDPHGELLPISEYESMVCRMFARQRNGVCKAAMDSNQASR
ncbi:hypothetical protein GCM10027081_19300 [Cupriavidus yeoncheonensis]